MSTAFSGFPQEARVFLEDLVLNNNRDWFNEHKSDYTDHVLAPTQSFVAALGERLQTLSPDIQYDTNAKGTGSIMRIYRDIRFSKDKTPYHTYMRVIFWEGTAKKNENPAFYFGLDANGAKLMAGLMGFSKPVLAAYRHAIDDAQLGTELEQIAATLRDSGNYEIDGEQSKRVPTGFPKDHPREGWLRYKGLKVSTPAFSWEHLQDGNLVEKCMEHCQKMISLHRWLVKMASSAE